MWPSTDNHGEEGGEDRHGCGDMFFERLLGLFDFFLQFFFDGHLTYMISLLALSGQCRAEPYAQVAQNHAPGHIE